jgi:hypothetical protein
VGNISSPKEPLSFREKCGERRVSPFPAITGGKSNQRFNVMFVEGCARQIALPVSFQYCIEFPAAEGRNPLRIIERNFKETEGGV